jgi:adenylate cyclase, class 2
MNTEYEAKLTLIDKYDIRSRLQHKGATLTKPEVLQRRVVFLLPKGHEIAGGWLRVRDEGDKVTTSLKVVNGTQITDQRELMLKIDNFDTAVSFLTSIGCTQKSYQENKRELWTLDGAEVTIDEWPYLEPFVEIEGASENIVRRVSEKLGFDWSQAIFGSTHLLTARKYGIPEDVLNNEIPGIVFDEDNPYLEWQHRHKS